MSVGELGILGLTPEQEAVYESLLGSGAATAVEVCQDTGLSTELVAPALRALAGRGLLVELVGSEERFEAAAPEPALEALVQQHQLALARVRAHGRQLTREFVRAGERRHPGELVAVLEGGQVVQSHFEQLQRQATREVLILDRPPYPQTGGTGSNPLMAERIASGVVYRTVYDHSLLDEERTFARVRRDLANGEVGRVISGLPLKLAIGDRAMALLPLLDADEHHEQAALLIRPSVLLDSLVALFEALWARAVPLTTGSGPMVDADPELREVVALLAAGLTDERIARHLGTSDRTVRRKIAAALEVLGADTRFQAGVKAHQLGWFGPD